MKEKNKKQKRVIKTELPRGRTGAYQPCTCTVGDGGRRRVLHTAYGERGGTAPLTPKLLMAPHTVYGEQVMSAAIELYRRWLLDASKRPSPINAEPHFFIRVCVLSGE